MTKVELWFVVREAPDGPLLIGVCLSEEQAKSRFLAARHVYKEAISIVPGEGTFQEHDPEDDARVL